MRSTATQIDLIFESAPWTLGRAPIEALRVFTASSRLPSLPADKVLKFLSGLEDLSCDEEPSLLQLFLEYMIDSDGSAEAAHHDALVDSYLTQLRALIKQMNALKDTPDATPTKTAAADPVGRRKQLARLAMLQEGTRAKLRAFLQASDLYSVQLCLQSSEDLATELSSERVILQARCGLHEQVLKTYLLELGDADNALQYCLFVCHQHDRVRREARAKAQAQGVPVPAAKAMDVSDVFTRLLAVIFSPEYRAKYPDVGLEGKGSAPVAKTPKAAGPLGLSKDYVSWSQRATIILEHFWRLIDPVALVNVAPSDLPVHLMYGYFKRVLPYLTHERNTAAVGLSLARMEALQGKAKLLQAR